MLVTSSRREALAALADRAGRLAVISARIDRAALADRPTADTTGTTRTSTAPQGTGRCGRA